jgi:peroxiredoxin family protein
MNVTSIQEGDRTMSQLTPQQIEIMGAQVQSGIQQDSGNFICSRDTIDGVYPSLILAINARRLGMEASVFYTFMGINVVRKGRAKKVKFVPNGVMGAIPGMSAFATWMMKKKIDKASIPTIEELMEVAQLEGVRLVACRMTMDMLELTPDDLIEGVEILNAEEFMKHARKCKINLFT